MSNSSGADRSIAIRRLSRRDADAYRALRLRGLREVPPAFSESDVEFERQTAAQIEETLEDPAGLSHVFGAFEGSGALVGLVGLSRDAPEKLRHKAYIWGMYVAPEQHGRGVGKRLLQAAIAHAQDMPGLEQLRLLVGEANTGAVRLYETVGFKRFGREPRELKADGRYYDSLHMWLDLTAPRPSVIR